MPADQTVETFTAPLLLPGQAVSRQSSAVGRLSGLFRSEEGLYFDLVIWSSGAGFGFNLEGEDVDVGNPEIPVAPVAHLRVVLGSERFELTHGSGQGVEIVGGGTVTADTFHFRFLVPATGALPDTLHVTLDVPKTGVHLAWDVSLAPEGGQPS